MFFFVNVVGEKASDLFSSTVIFCLCRILLIYCVSSFGDHCTSLTTLCWELWRIWIKISSLLLLQNTVLSTTRQTPKLPFGDVLVLLNFSCITVEFFLFLVLCFVLFSLCVHCTVRAILCSQYSAINDDGDEFTFSM